jgi:hypothetical protein
MYNPLSILQNSFENPLAKFFFGLVAVHSKGRYFASMLHLGCNFGFNQCWPLSEKTPGYQLKQKWKITYPPCTFHSKNWQDPYGLGIETSKFNDFTQMIGISSK